MHDVTATFGEAQLHAVVGPARSGKTLLMHLLGLLDEPDFGSVELFGEPVSPAPDELRREVRSSIFGYVFPNPCLLAGFSVAENIAMPLFRVSTADELIAHRRVCELLEPLGLADVANDGATELSPARQHLVALARALVHRPRIVMLIEPRTEENLTAVARRIVDEMGITVLWSGAPGVWTDACDTVTQLEPGGVLAVAP